MNFKEWEERRSTRPASTKRPTIYYITWIVIAGTITADIRLLQYDLVWKVIGAVIFGCVMVLTIFFIRWTNNIER